MDFDQVWKIMEISFPPEERRKREKQRELLEKEEYLLYGVKQGENLLGFLAAWELGDFLFMEHFAISPEARNSGLGHWMLQELQAKGHQKIVLGGAAQGLPLQNETAPPGEKKTLSGIIRRTDAGRKPFRQK